MLLPTFLLTLFAFVQGANDDPETLMTAVIKFTSRTVSWFIFRPK